MNQTKRKSSTDNLVRGVFHLTLRCMGQYIDVASGCGRTSQLAILENNDCGLEQVQRDRALILRR